MIRSSVTFYDDQYKFWKSFNSPKIFLACAEYMFEDIEPQWLTEQEKVLFESLRIRMDNQKKKSFAWSCSHWWWRPKKTTEIETKKQHKNNTKTTEQTTKKQEDKDKEEDKDKDKDISIRENNNINVITETEVSEYWKKEINELIFLLKQEANHLWIAYDTTKERYFAKFILTAKEFWNFCEKIWQKRVECAINIMKASIHINYWKWICSWPMKIYQNYSDVYNETLKFKNKNSKNLIPSF